MKVLVTGGAGFIGSHCCISLIAAGNDVVVIDDFSNSSPSTIELVQKIVECDVRWYRCSLLNREELVNVFRLESPDAVIHFAALKSVSESVVDPLGYYDINVHGTINVLRAMASVDCYSFIFSSSATVYGDGSSPVPFKENAERKAINPYGKTKMVVEDLLSDLAASGAPWSIVNLRYFNPAGAHSTHLIGENPNATPTNLFPVIVRSLQDPNPRVRVFGTDYPTADGTCIRDYVHVVDLADGHVNALRAIHNSNQYWTVNLGTGSGCSVLEVVRAFELVSSVPIALDFCPRRPGDAAVSVADTSRALELLGWKSKYSLADMCFDSFEFARKRRG